MSDTAPNVHGHPTWIRQLLTAVAAIVVVACSTDVRSPQSEVFVIGALGALHEREESFGFDVLDRVVRTIDPDVVLLEVTPDELAGRADTRGRPEYPRVVWPLLEEPDAPTPYAMEAGQPLYDELVAEASRTWGDFAERSPEENAALQTWTEAMTEALLAHWNRPSDTQDETTDDVARARNALRGALLPSGRRIQVRWDSVMVGAVHRAVDENPGSRILVIGTFRNRFMFEEALEALPQVTIVDMPAWLEANGFGSARAPDRPGGGTAHPGGSERAALSSAPPDP